MIMSDELVIVFLQLSAQSASAKQFIIDSLIHESANSPGGVRLSHCHVTVSGMVGCTTFFLLLNLWENL